MVSTRAAEATFSTSGVPDPRPDFGLELLDGPACAGTEFLEGGACRRARLPVDRCDLERLLVLVIVGVQKRLVSNCPGHSTLLAQVTDLVQRITALAHNAKS